MQKGMPNAWPTCLKLSAALSLPSLSLIYLSLPVHAEEGLQESSPASAHLSRTHGSGRYPHSLEPPKPANGAATGIAAPFGTPEGHVSGSPQMELPHFEAQFSSLQPGPEQIAQTPEQASPDTPKEDVFSPLPESAETETAEPVPEAEDILSPAEDADANDTLEGTDIDSEADETSETDTAEEATPEADIEEKLDIEDGLPPGEPLPGVSGDAVPIPVETVVDPLQFLDPNPNPLLIQTQPEEVEIIGTQPLTLEEAVELAYRNNPDLRIVQLELEQSQAALREAEAALFPTLSVNGALQGQNSTDTSLTAGGIVSEESIGALGSAQIDATYSLFSSGARRASINAAKEQVQFSELEVERRREELRIAVANDYYDLQEAIEGIRINQAFLEEAERNLRDTSLREEVGVGTRFDVLRAEVQVANARQDLVNSQASRQVAERTLASTLNVPTSFSVTTEPVEIAGDWSLNLEESIVLAFQNRAELEQQLTQREISEQLRRQELAALGPQVSLFANYTVSDNLVGPGSDDSFSDSYQLGVQVSMDLFEGGAARARARQQELGIEIADRNFEEFRNGIRAEVETAFFTLQSNFTNIDTATLAVEQAQEALDLAILRFDAGVGTQLDILDAQSELTDAEVNLVQAVVGYNRSLATLERAVSNIPESTYEQLPF